MKISSRLFTGVAPVVLGFALTASPVWAQDQDAQEEEAAAPAEASSSAIIVTGSRISRPNLESTVPITSIAGDTFFQQSQTNVGDTLNDLPQLRSTFAQQNPGLGIGIAGLSLLDLRGLGTQRTLVLVNGRRHVAADILNNAVSPDINTIPNDLIERVDIVTGGNSAVYGSDAIAGVVNFVLRKNYDGIQIRTQAGITEEGFGGNQYISAMVGRNFAEGRGNITVHAEYARTDRVFASDVKAFRTNDNFAVIDSDGGAGIVNGGDNFPDRAFFRNISSSTIHFNGLVPVNQRNIPNAGACGNATAPNNGAPNTAGPAFNCTLFFNNAGRLVTQTGTRVGTGINPTIINSNGQTGREGKSVSILPFLERFNFNLLGNFEVSTALEFFVEAKWNRVNALGNNAGPSFVQGTRGTVDFREDVRLDNPFLNPADRTQLADAFLASGCRSSLLTACGPAGNLTAADRANIANGSFRFVNARSLVDVGLRDSRFQRDTYRIVGGARGTFNDDWNYEVSANYGKFKENTLSQGFLDRQRFALAMDAGRNPVTGQIQCRSQFDPASAVQLVGLSPGDAAAGNAARLAADIAACVPYNPFGAPDNSASIAYFSAPFETDASLSQFVATAFVSGDLSQLFELPGGPISFAIGGEYREEKAFYEQDAFTRGGFTNAVSIPTFAPQPFEVKEAFGEVRIPVLRDQLVHELTFSGAGRVSKYQGGVGTVYSYNAGVDLAPIEDIRFRANYSRAVRAPNVSETGFPLVPNFATFSDPCDPGRRGTGIRAANCAADLGALLGNLNDVTYSLPIVSGSNPNLNVETSDSYTYGVVIRPRFLPGFTLSVDYYDISVDGVIASVGAQTIANQCYDSPTLDNIFCRQFTRFRGPGTGPLGEIPGRVLGNSLINAPLNFATRKREGIDVNLDYRRNFGDVSFSTNLIYTHVLTNSNFQDPTNPDFETRNRGQLGDPKDEFRWDVDLGVGPATFGYRMRYIGPMFIDTFNTFFEINDLPPINIDAYPNQKINSVMYHDLRADFKVDSGPSEVLFSVGVDNVLDKGVPEGAGTATGAGSAIYSFRGRSFYASARMRF